MKAFFDAVRAAYGSLSQDQVDGFNRLIAASNDMPLRHQAYLLATAWWESARTMQPIHERGTKDYFKKYDAGTSIGKALGNTMPGDGYKFRGRGDIMITGRRNYAKASAKVGVDLVADPDKALDPLISAKIIVAGMSEGWFTGKKLADYQTYEDMRRVVNGTDRAVEIGIIARVMEKGLMAAAREAVQPVPPPPVVIPPPPDVEPVSEPLPPPPAGVGKGVAAVLITGAAAVLTVLAKVLGAI